MRRTLTTTFVLVWLLLAGHVAWAKSKSKAAEKQEFCEDGAPDDLALKPTPLPSVVLTTVMNTKEGKEARQLAKRNGSELVPEELLEGTTVRLTDSHELFFVVMGSSPMSGADNTWFWVVRRSGKVATVLLWAGANCLDVSRTKTLGYRNIVTRWSSASFTVAESYRYNGASYKLWRTKEKEVEIPLAQSTRYFKAEHGVGATYVRLGADGRYKVIDREHMGIFLTDEGHWQQTGAVITFSPKDPKKSSYCATENQHNGKIFLAITSPDAAAGIVISAQDTNKDLDTDPNHLPYHVLFNISAKTYKTETKETYPFRYIGKRR